MFSCGYKLEKSLKNTFIGWRNENIEKIIENNIHIA